MVQVIIIYMKVKEYLYHGGTVYTVDKVVPHADAVAVRNGMIVNAGTKAECRSCLGSDYVSIDLKGGFLLPGFFDCHIHATPTVFYHMNVNLNGTKDFPGLIKSLKEAGVKNDGWIIGCNFDEEALDDKRLPTKSDLDKVSKDRPVIIIKHDGHSVIANTKAIEIAGITSSTPEPDGGYIDRDNSGSPLGIFREAPAVSLILNHMPMPGENEIIEASKGAFNKMLSMGITSLGCMLQTDEVGPAGMMGAFDIPIMQMIRRNIPQSLYLWVITKDVNAITGLLGSSLNDPSIERLTRIAGLKIIADGSFGTCTSAMFEPFSDQSDKKGFMIFSDDELMRLMKETHAAGFQLAIHGIGDLAIDKLLGLFERLDSEKPVTASRHRIEHASIMYPDMLKRAEKLGLIMSVQPMFLYSEKHWLEKRVGARRMRWTYPFKSMIDSGLKVAGSSDSPVEVQDTLHAIECCVTREGLVPEEAISIAQAIEMFTIGGAYAQFEEGIKGSITAGKRADFAVLAENPFKVSPDTIRNIPVKMTVVAGEIVYTY
jgi:predicted amidohydrolase YtcJ